jgi:hypothetical protein
VVTEEKWAKGHDVDGIDEVHRDAIELLGSHKVLGRIGEYEVSWSHLLDGFVTAAGSG